MDQRNQKHEWKFALGPFFVALFLIFMLHSGFFTSFISQRLEQGWSKNRQERSEKFVEERKKQREAARSQRTNVTREVPAPDAKR